MKRIQKYTPFIASALLMYAVLYIIYPHYRYYVDPDGTAYLTISQRYADGIFVQAINGYWSPWSCWLTALLIKAGLQPIPASVIINSIGAGALLYISQSFFLKFRIERMLQWVLNMSLIVFLCFAIFWQSFDDLWECFFLLSALRIMLNNQFTARPALWVAMGCMGALAYFAKAYAFPFYILNTVCCVYFITHKDKGQWLKICAVAIITMVAFSTPWIYALNYKYGIWTTSTAGSLNMSWYLVGHPYWRDGIKLLPPAYPDSPYYWEDPYVSNGVTPHFWSSWHLFGLQFLRIGLNVYELVVSMLQLSVFVPLIALAALFSFRNQKLRSLFDGQLKIIACSFLLFPVGYLLVNFESRYLWYMLPLGMVMMGVLLKAIKNAITTWFQNLIYLLLSLSFTIYPVWQLSKMYDVGRNDHEIAQELKNLGIHGSFTSTCKPGGEMQSIIRIAYFSGNAYYLIPYPGIPHDSLLYEMKRYQVNYFITYDGSSYAPELKDEVFLNENGIRVTGIYITTSQHRGGIKIYKVN